MRTSIANINCEHRVVHVVAKASSEYWANVALPSDGKLKGFLRFSPWTTLTALWLSNIRCDAKLLISAWLQNLGHTGSRSANAVGWTNSNLSGLLLLSATQALVNFKIALESNRKVHSNRSLLRQGARCVASTQRDQMLLPCLLCGPFRQWTSQPDTNCIHISNSHSQVIFRGWSPGNAEQWIPRCRYARM